MNNTVKKAESVAANERRKLSFGATEAYKTIRTNIVFMLSQAEKKSFVISSLSEAEGKSTTCVNVARAFAEMGSRVLLIDSDLRKPTVHKKMRISNTKGLSSILVGFCSADDAIQKVSKNLDVITAGPIPPNQSELLCSAAMQVLIKGLEARYDYVIFDTPPFGIVSDAMLLAQRTAGVIMVVRAGSTNIEHVKRANTLAETAGTKILGVVMNAVSNKNRKYNYYKKKKYGYKYYSENYQ